MWEDLASHYQSPAPLARTIIKRSEWLGRSFILENIDTSQNTQGFRRLKAICYLHQCIRKHSNGSNYMLVTGGDVMTENEMWHE